jgi:hypothetical protein
MFSAEKKCRLLLAVSQSLGGGGAMMYIQKEKFTRRDLLQLFYNLSPCTYLRHHDLSYEFTIKRYATLKSPNPTTTTTKLF